MKGKLKFEGGFIMKRLLYFPIGVIVLICDCIRYIINRGEIVVSNYEFYNRMEKKIKTRT